MFPNGHTIVPSYPIAGNRTELESNGRHEPNGLASLDERGRQSTQLSGLKTNSGIAADKTDTERELENQIPYKPRSQALSLNTLIPTAALKGLENAFNKVEAVSATSVDEYVRHRLREPSMAELFEHYAAEQIDSLALSIYNHEFENKATLIGHDTGIGKTRIICGIARYAQLQNLIPVIVTVDPVLYGDILARDAVDTGNKFNPLITNNKLNIALTSSLGEQIGEINTPINQHLKIRDCLNKRSIGEHDCIFTTYGQLTGPASIERRQLLETLASRTFLILDESHKAGGASVDQLPQNQAQKAHEQKKNEVESCTEFFQKLVKLVPGFVASSATAIKDPIVAARLFYETTDLKLAASDRETFTEHLKAGGVPLQQQVFAMWAESGGVIPIRFG
jgi:hypothetical protein